MLPDIESDLGAGMIEAGERFAAEVRGSRNVMRRYSFDEPITDAWESGECVR